MNFIISKSWFKELDKKKIVFILILVILFLFFDLYFILGTQIKINKELSLKIKGLRTKIRTFEKEFALMQEALKKTSDIKPVKIIKEDEISKLIEELSMLAKQNNVEIFQIKPQKEPKITAPSAELIPYFFYLNLNSNYNSLLNFINNLESSFIITSVEELEISQNPKNIFKHNINLTLKLYVKK